MNPHWFQQVLSYLSGLPPSIPDPTEIPPLTNEGYEALFTKILDGVAKGWHQSQVLENMGIRRYDPWFGAWLQRYGRNLLRQPPSNPTRQKDLARRLIRLGSMDCGEVSDLAKQIGARLLELHEKASSSYTLPPDLAEKPSVLFKKAREKYETGDLEGSVVLWEALLKQQPDLVEARNACGVALYYLKRYEEAVRQFDRLLKTDSDCVMAYFNRGYTYLELQKNEAAIADFTHVLEFEIDAHLAYYGRGLAKQALKRYTEAITDFNRALDLQPNFALAYNARGITQAELGKQEEALRDFNQALLIDPNYHDAYYNLGKVFWELGEYEQALDAFTQALLVEPNLALAYYCRGNTYCELGRYEEALSDYQKTLNLQPDYAPAYNGRGIALRYLGRYDDAIEQFNQAIKIQADFWQAWINRGWTIYKAPAPLGYTTAIQSWQEGLTKLEPTHPDYPLFVGSLHHYTGQAHSQRGENQKEPRFYQDKAVESYQKALEVLQDRPELTEFYLEVIEDLIIVYSDLDNHLNAKNYVNMGLVTLQQLVDKATNSSEAVRLSQKFAGLYQLKVDRLAVSNDPSQHIQALELAEERHNISLAQWSVHRSQALSPSPKYAQMQQLLDANTCGIYWHLSPGMITTFVLRYEQPLVVLTSTPEGRSRYKQWWENWQYSYEAKRQHQGTPAEISQWRQQMDPRLQELGGILQLDRILGAIPETVTQLILIPHQELHLVPLHFLFTSQFESQRDWVVTYLPTAKLGLSNTIPKTEGGLLTVEHPREFNPYTELEILAIAPFFPWLYRLTHTNVTPNNLLQSCQKKPRILHFTGPSYQLPAQPHNSAILLANGQKLTLLELQHFEFPSPELVCLIHNEIRMKEDELSSTSNSFQSVFLSKGSRYVLTTLWSVPEISTSLFMILFYQLIAQGIAPPEAFKQTQQWLRNLTYQDLEKFYEKWLQKSNGGDHQYLHPLKVAQEVAQEKAKQWGNTARPYHEPYYWAGFILSGRG